MGLTPIAARIVADGRLTKIKVIHMTAISRRLRTITRVLIYGCLFVGFTYDRFGQDFSDGPDMQVPRWQHTATLLQNCQVLIAGGGNHGYEGDTRLAERFDPQTNNSFEPERFRFRLALLKVRQHC